MCNLKEKISEAVLNQLPPVSRGFLFTLDPDTGDYIQLWQKATCLNPDYFQDKEIPDSMTSLTAVGVVCMHEDALHAPTVEDILSTVYKGDTNSAHQLPPSAAVAAAWYTLYIKYCATAECTFCMKTDPRVRDIAMRYTPKDLPNNMQLPAALYLKSSNKHILASVTAKLRIDHDTGAVTVKYLQKLDAYFFTSAEPLLYNMQKTKNIYEASAELYEDVLPILKSSNHNANTEVYDYMHSSATNGHGSIAVLRWTCA